MGRCTNTYLENDASDLREEELFKCKQKMLAMNIIIKDDSLTGKTQNQIHLEVSEETCTVKELIKKRIFQEVANYNNRRPEYFKSLVQPTDAEQTLNGYRFREKRQVDPEKQYYLALDAFLKNGFFILVNDQQVEGLENELQLVDNMEVSFVKLTPLVGG